MVGADVVHSVQREEVNMARSRDDHSHSSTECRVGGCGQDHGDGHLRPRQAWGEDLRRQQPAGQDRNCNNGVGGGRPHSLCRC